MSHQTIGLLMLLCPFIGMFFWVVKELGFKPAVFGALFIVASMGWILLGSKLASGGL